ncbi:MAG: sugar ABC transporter substrate-binding protein [Armatimonadetes bacterium]|nr:sugar ABC transporter substrate-binding protein [Armatimonadota bacterium]
MTLFTWVREDELASNQELVRKFQNEHPGISVRIINVPGSMEAMAKLHTMVAGGEAPDVASLHGAYYLSFADSGALYDLNQFIAQDPEFDLQDFHPRLVQMCRWKGKLFSLPRYTSLYALFYNKDLFDAAGVPYPDKQGEWTWQNYLDTVRKLTLDIDGDGRKDQWGCYIDFWGARIYPWLWQNGADLMDPGRTRLTLDTSNAIEALTFVVNLRQKYVVTPEPTPGERNEGLELFAQGKVATYISGPWDVRELRRRAHFAWDVWHLPKKKRRATMLGTENYAVMAATKHPKEAWELFKFLLSKDSQAFMAEQQENMPSRISVLKGPYLQANAGYNRKVFVDALEYAQAPPNIPEWDKVQHLLQEELDLIWIGKKSVKQGVADAVRKVNAALKGMRKEK